MPFSQTTTFSVPEPFFSPAGSDDSSSSASTIGKINPIRYRSYYYDSETGFYYLQSRYYDPQVGRFINADEMLSANGGSLGSNAFVYCFNNVVSSFDPDGYDAVLLFQKDWGRGFGHAAVLFESSNHCWYYFSVCGRDKNNKNIKIIDLVRICYGHKKDMRNLDKINSYINKAGKEQELFSVGAYTSSYYFVGNFSKLLNESWKIKRNPGKYDFIFSNCLHAVSYLLLQGRCTGKDADAYQAALMGLRTMTSPNSASYAMYHFMNTYEYYCSLPTWRKILYQLFNKDPYYYFYN